MPRYFIHIRTRTEIDRDEVGIECASLDEARDYATNVVLEYVNITEDLNLELLDTLVFEIVREGGRREAVLRFSDALPEPIKT